MAGGKIDDTAEKIRPYNRSLPGGAPVRIERHPRMNVWVREDGCVYLPQSGKHPAHWTFGCKNRYGYLIVKITGKLYRVHRLVAETFIGPIPEGMEIDHINRSRSDNRLENIRIVTPSENKRNTSTHDRVDASGGTHPYEDRKQYYREFYYRNHEKALAQKKEYCNTHKKVLFSDGKRRYVTNEKAAELLKLPVKERVWP